MSDAKFYNQIVPELVQKSKSFSDKLKKRVRVTALLTDYENQASDEFRKYVKESSKRYKEMRFGSSLGEYLSRSKERYQNVAKKILSDPFYTKFNIDEEAKVLKTRPKLKYLKELKSLTDSIKSRECPKSPYFEDIKPKIENKLEDQPETEGDLLSSIRGSKSHKRSIFSRSTVKTPLDQLEDNKMSCKKKI